MNATRSTNNTLKFSSTAKQQSDNQCGHDEAQNGDDDDGGAPMNDVAKLAADIPIAETAEKTTAQTIAEDVLKTASVSTR